jgi:hypothetical protein
MHPIRLDTRIYLNKGLSSPYTHFLPSVLMSPYSCSFQAKRTVPSLMPEKPMIGGREKPNLDYNKNQNFSKKIKYLHLSGVGLSLGVSADYRISFLPSMITKRSVHC